MDLRKLQFLHKLLFPYKQDKVNQQLAGQLLVLIKVWEEVSDQYNHPRSQEDHQYNHQYNHQEDSKDCSRLSLD